MDADGSYAFEGHADDFVKSRLLPFKYARSVIYLRELPKTGTGKIDRQALKAARQT